MSVEFCSACGFKVEMKEWDGRIRAICPQCGKIHFDQLIVGAGGVILRDGKLLLIQRAHEPFKECWGLPAGHVEADEHPRDAAIREVSEETGLRVAAGRLIDCYYFTDHPRGHGVFLVYECSASGEFVARTDEALAMNYFSADSLPANLAGGGHSLAVIAWRDSQITRS